MAQFSGLTDIQWGLLEGLLDIRQYVRGKGRPPANPRYVLNSICWILITGARWCDLPKGPQWASRPAAHRWLGTWLESGVLEKVLTALQEIASIAKMINFERLAVDGSHQERGAVKRLNMGTKAKE